jgi:hypothetical protein
MSGLVLLFPRRPLKPAPKISGENRRRFYFEAIRRRERDVVEREPPAEILSEPELAEGNAEREPAGEIPSIARDLLLSGSLLPKSRSAGLAKGLLLEPICRRPSPCRTISRVAWL